MTSSTRLCTETNHYASEQHSINGIENNHTENEFTIDDDESYDDDSSLYMKAQESRRILREMVGNNSRSSPDTASGSKKMISNGYDDMGPASDPPSKDNEFEESGYCVRVWIRILIVLMLFSYISTMMTWVSRMKKHGSLKSPHIIDMSDVCSLIRLKNNDKKQCQDICSPYRCCWDMDYKEEQKQNENCIEKYEVSFCTQFLSCRNMLISFNDTNLSNVNQGYAN